MGETLRRLREYCGKLPSQAEAAAERCIQVSADHMLLGFLFFLLREIWKRGGDRPYLHSLKMSVVFLEYGFRYSLLSFIYFLYNKDPG